MMKKPNLIPSEWNGVSICASALCVLVGSFAIEEANTLRFVIFILSLLLGVTGGMLFLYLKLLRARAELERDELFFALHWLSKSEPVHDTSQCECLDIASAMLERHEYLIKETGSRGVMGKLEAENG
jgi:hypothetical protein